MTKVTVLGAGSIGCYVAGCLLSSGAVPSYVNSITLIGRERLQQDIAKNGIKVTDWQGRKQIVNPENVTFALDNKSLEDADYILLCVKSQDTAHAAKMIKQWAKPSAIVISLQNGVSNPSRLRKYLSQEVIAGMVPFNVFYKGQGHFHCGTEGNLALEDPQGLCKPLISGLENASLPVTVYEDIVAVQYGKLIMNLNNAVNALSGVPLKKQLGDRQYRRVMAQVLSEALEVLNAEGITPARTGKVIPQLMPTIMKLPNFLFNIVAASTLKIDPEARSSMYEDLLLGRRTEVDYLNGEIVRLGEKNKIPTPVNRHIVSLVKQSEHAKSGSPHLAANALLVQ
ncbi:2-dehydropantoate 2-reductase [Alteromonas mediterranea]|uniref:2-dehydropantoate 2-reductase n=1 Tax=Alteromonas mediterranea TaxID=314275 RepID=UPI0009039E99|nr:2-dehydropantoate 2-reductase [Alteromonas mediterranea]APE01424.1 2-dehydropantoate 2-reductase [Alteromonas mediterranea]